MKHHPTSGAAALAAAFALLVLAGGGAATPGERCDPAAISGLRFEVDVRWSKRWATHASVILDVTNAGAEDAATPRDVNLAGLRLAVDLPLRIGVPSANTTSPDLEWVPSSSDTFTSFCVYGEMVPGEDTDNRASDTPFLMGVNACDEYVQLNVDSGSLQFSFALAEEDGVEGSRNDTSSASVISLCSGCHFGGGIGWSKGIQGMLYHEMGGVLDVDSLSRTVPTVTCDGMAVDAKVDATQPAGAQSVRFRSPSELAKEKKEEKEVAGTVSSPPRWAISLDPIPALPLARQPMRSRPPGQPTRPLQSPRPPATLPLQPAVSKTFIPPLGPRLCDEDLLKASSSPWCGMAAMDATETLVSTFSVTPIFVPDPNLSFTATQPVELSVSINITNMGPHDLPLDGVVVPLLFPGGVIVPTFGVFARAKPEEWVVYCLGGQLVDSNGKFLRGDACTNTAFRALHSGIFEVRYVGRSNAPVLCAGCSLISWSFIVKHVKYLPMSFDPDRTLQPWDAPFCDCGGGGEAEGDGGSEEKGSQGFGEGTKGDSEKSMQPVSIHSTTHVNEMGKDERRASQQKNCPSTLRVNITTVGTPSPPSPGPPAFGYESHVDIYMDLTNLGSADVALSTVTVEVLYPHTVWTELYGFVGDNPDEFVFECVGGRVVGERSRGGDAGGVASVCEDGVSGVTPTDAGWKITFRQVRADVKGGEEEKGGEGRGGGKGHSVSTKPSVGLEPLCSGCTLQGRDGDGLFYRFSHRRMFPLQISALRTSVSCQGT